MKLVSLGSLCSPATQIVFRRGQGGIVSPFSWQRSTPEVVLNILQDDFVTLLNRDKYVYNIQKGYTHFHSRTNTPNVSDPYTITNELIVGELGYHLSFAHSDPLENLDDYQKLQAQCDYLKKCLNTSDGVGYLMNIFQPYEWYTDVLVGIRKIIPEDCKFFVCLMRKEQNLAPKLNEDNIYYGAFDIGDHTQRLVIPSAKYPKPNFLDKWKDYDGAHAYGMSEEYTKMVDKIFY